MYRLLLLALLPVLHACGESPVAPSPLPPALPPPPVVQAPPPIVAVVRDVTLGERVEGVFGDGQTIGPPEHHFYLTAPRDGTLEVTLEWDPNYVGTLLMLRLENQSFPPTPAGWSPVVGRLAVQAGGRYLIAVALAGADWLPEDPFVLTTSLVP
jgi:hypothetical protein